MAKANFMISEIIGKIRDQLEIDVDEIEFVVTSLSNGHMNDAQAGAFAMAVLCRDLSPKSVIELTRSMRDSGEVLAWDVDGKIVDKHSTGGVGDCVSLALAPILASAGLYVPMISGRGLGHTGGTLDKLEAIKGFSTALPHDKMQSQLKSVGAVMASASKQIAPADKRLYAVRDVTGTVPARPLIVSSILSKKLAAGLDELVLDVKFGAGAFMKSKNSARDLAECLVLTSVKLGCPAKALITNMDIPLATSVGNALEVAEILNLLEGQIDSRLYQVTRELCSEFGVHNVDEIVQSGRAMETFEKMVSAQGGPNGASNIRKSLEDAKYVEDFVAPRDIEFNGFNAYEVGMAVVEIGGGRTNPNDKIDLSVGIAHIASPKKIRKGDLMARIHCNSKVDAVLAKNRLNLAIERAVVSDKPSIDEQLILDKVTS